MKAFAALAAGLSLAGHAGGASPRVETIAAANSPIHAFAANAGTLAWVEQGRAAQCQTLVFFDLRQRRARKLRGRDSSCSAGGASLAIGGGRAGWAYSYGGNRTTTDLYFASPTRIPRRPLASFTAEYSSFGEGLYASGPVAGGSTLAYGWYEVEVVQTRACRESFECETRIGRGGIQLVNGLARGRRISRAPVAQLALSGDGLAAYVRVTKGWHETGRERPGALRSVVEVINLSTGTRRLRLSVSGRVRALAFSDGLLLALSGTSVRRYHGGTGRLLGRTRVGRVSSRLEVAGTRAVVAGVRSLVEIDLRTGRALPLVRTTATPIGFALVGNRLLWAENVGHPSAAQGRVRALALVGS